jgi:hypothetical protein
MCFSVLSFSEPGQFHRYSWRTPRHWRTLHFIISYNGRRMYKIVVWERH